MRRPLFPSWILRGRPLRNRLFVGLVVTALPADAFAQVEARDGDEAPQPVADEPAAGDVPPLPAEPAAPAATESPTPAAFQDVTEEPPHEEPYVRHGFTMELGIGVSYTSVFSDDAAKEHAGVGIAPLSFAFGGFLSPRLALFGRGAGTTTFRRDASGTTYGTVNALYGPSLQYWATDRLFVGGGPGLAVLLADPYSQARGDVGFGAIGFGVNARVGLAFALLGDHHALNVSFEVFASRFDALSTVAGALNVGWQFL
jgi:hypothetical protein